MIVNLLKFPLGRDTTTIPMTQWIYRIAATYSVYAAVYRKTLD